MSHFRVAVFSNDPRSSAFEELLAPYSETDENYFEFEPIEEESLDWNRKFYDEHKPYPTFEEYMTHEGYINDPDSGELGYMHNPNAKWDYYTLNGGDFQFEFRNGHHYDEEGHAKKNDFEYRQAVNLRTKEKEWKEKKALVDSFEPGDDKSLEQIAEYEDAKRFIDYHPVLGDYLIDCVWDYPYAFITPDGVWHSPGTVGWFAFSDDSPESRQKYLQEWINWIQSSENPYVNFVDCHI